jgi:hypothetical protein
VALSNTAGVVIHLVSMLPKQTYHVFMDNLFSSPNLFRALREAGHGATGIARPNCGSTKELKLAKGRDKAGASGFKYNEVKSIPTIDDLVRPGDLFICISLTNSSFLGRSNRLEG